MTTSINNPENIQERYADYYGLDSDVTPEIPMKGLLGWTGTGWEKITSTGGALNITGPYWSLASADTGVTGDKSGSFTIDTTGNVEAGIVRTNNYQNAVGDESLIWNNGSDWWEFSNDVYVTGSLTESVPSLFKLDQSGTPQTVSGGSPIFQDGITFFASNQFTLTQDGVNTIADVDGGYYKLTSPYRQESGTSLFIDAAPLRFFAGHQESITQNDDLFTGANNELVVDIGMDVSKYSGGATDNYGTGCLDGKTAHRFYCNNQRTYQNGSIETFTAGVYGAVDLKCNINSAGAILSTRNMAFYSDIYFLGKETSGTHNAQNFLFSGLLETEGHEVINGTVLNAVLYADNDGFIVEETDETHMILDLSSYPWTKRADNSKIIMGAGDDFETYWDGTDQILDPHTVGGGGIKIITGNDTSIETDELSIDLSVLVPDLVITTPVLKATANSTLPEVIPFPYALGVYDRFTVFAQGTFDKPEILFAYNDFSVAASIGGDLTNEHFWVNWNWCPEEDDAYSLGLSTLRWTDIFLSRNIYLADTSSSNSGVITKDGTSWLHNFRHPSGDTARPEGYNTFVGKSSGNFTMGSTASAVTHASRNTGIGELTLTSLTTGYGNFAGGTLCLSSLTEGANNVALGSAALRYCITGSGNFGLGYASLNLETGNYNVAIGYASSSYSAGTTQNVCIGYNSGRYYGSGTDQRTSGSYNVLIGGTTKTSANGVSNEIAIGYATIGLGANTARIGNANMTDLFLYADNYKLRMGAAGDFSGFYDGTTAHLKTSEVAPSDLDVTCGSQKTIRLVNTVWEDVQFNVESGRVAAANFPDWDASFTTNTGCFKFDVDDYIDLGTNEMPHWWKEGTHVYPHIHVALDGANTSGSSQYVKFTVYLAYADVNEVFTETNKDMEIEIPNGTADLTHLLGTSTSVDFSAVKIGSQINVRLKRIAATTGTEYPNHIFVTQFGIHAEADTMGSRQISTK